MVRARDPLGDPVSPADLLSARHSEWSRTLDGSQGQAHHQRTPGPAAGYLRTLNTPAPDAAEERRRQAREDSQRQADLAVALDDFELETKILAARGSGDSLGASHLERQLNINRATRDFQGQGMSQSDARELATNRVNLQWTLGQQQGLSEQTIASSARSVGLGGNAFSNREDIQRKMASLQEQANRYLGEQSALLKRIEAKLQSPEVFD